MVQLLQIVALLLLAAAWAFAFAHAAEMPGKMRLDREAYLAVQTIYYPGFTIGGASEPLALLLLFILLGLTPPGTGFWWTAVALIATALTHLIFWLVTQPVNRLWVREQELGTAGSAFFATGPAAPGSDWIRLRNRWEKSHLVRAALLTIAFIAMAIAVAET